MQTDSVPQINSITVILANSSNKLIYCMWKLGMVDKQIVGNWIVYPEKYTIWNQRYYYNIN